MSRIEFMVCGTKVALGDRVIVTFVDGDKMEGFFSSYIDAFNNASEEDVFGLDTDDLLCYDISISEVASIEVVS